MKFHRTPAIASWPPGNVANCVSVRRSEMGAAVVELAISLPLMMILLAGIVDYGLLIQEQMTVSKAAAAGVAFGSIYGNQANLTGMQNAAVNAAAGVSGFSAVASVVYTCTPGGTPVSSTATCSGYGSPIKYVKVATQGNSTTMIAPFFLNLPATLTLQSATYFRVRWTP